MTSFYVAIAGAIPVLLVVYAVTLSAYTRDTVAPGYDKAIKESIASFLDLVASPRGKLGAAGRTLETFIRSTKNLVFLFAYMAAVIVPAIGEGVALYALASGSSSEWTEIGSWAGIAVAFGAVVLPLVVLGFEILPFSKSYSYWHAMKETQRLVKWIYGEWANDGAQYRWADSLTVHRVETGGNTMPLAVPRPPNVDPSLWGGVFPRWQASYFVDRNSLLVGDIAGDRRGATLFTIKDGEVIQILVYEDRGEATKAHPSLSGKTLLEDDDQMD